MTRRIETKAMDGAWTLVGGRSWINTFNGRQYAVEPSDDGFWRVYFRTSIYGQAATATAPGAYMTAMDGIKAAEAHAAKLYGPLTLPAYLAERNRRDAMQTGLKDRTFDRARLYYLAEDLEGGDMTHADLDETDRALVRSFGFHNPDDEMWVGDVLNNREAHYADAALVYDRAGRRLDA